MSCKNRLNLQLYWIKITGLLVSHYFKFILITWSCGFEKGD